MQTTTATMTTTMNTQTPANNNNNNNTNANSLHHLLNHHPHQPSPPHAPTSPTWSPSWSALWSPPSSATTSAPAMEPLQLPSDRVVDDRVARREGYVGRLGGGGGGDRIGSIIIGGGDNVVRPKKPKFPQWDAKLASFQRGIAHVLQCTAGDACGSSLCHATRRLMRTYATHDCPNKEECKVCKLWDYLLVKTTRSGAAMPLQVGAAFPVAAAGDRVAPRRVMPMSCGLASLAATSRRFHGGLVARSVAASSVATANHGNSSAVPRGASSSFAARARVTATPDLIKALGKRM
ncbi:hypothetical protein ATCC90586_002255 [Pythium insidiosum]|nr:hypothetical protein ATCC90586_002255 [Pythium insidiosum]